MALFLVSALPLGYLILLAFSGNTFEYNARTTLFAVRSFFIAVPFYVCFIFLRSTFPFQYSGEIIFVRTLLLDVALFVVPASLVYLLFRRFSKSSVQVENITTACAVFVGFFCLPGFLDGIVYFGRYDAYILFMRPLLRVGLVFVYAIALTYTWTDSTQRRVVGISFAFLYSLLLPCVALLFYLRYTLFSYAACGVFFLLPVVFAFIQGVNIRESASGAFRVPDNEGQGESIDADESVEVSDDADESVGASDDADEYPS